MGFVHCSPGLAFVLLQDNQVAAHFRVCVVREQVAWQTDGGKQVGIHHHFPTYRHVPAVHDTLRGDERHDAAVLHRVQRFQEEIIVDGF